MGSLAQGNCYICEIVDDVIQLMQTVPVHPGTYALRCRYSPDTKCVRPCGVPSGGSHVAVQDLGNNVRRQHLSFVGCDL